MECAAVAEWTVISYNTRPLLIASPAAQPLAGGWFPWFFIGG